MRLGIIGSLVALSLVGFKAPPRPSVFRIMVDAKTPGSVVTLHFVRGPDSLAGTTRRLTAGTTFQVSGDSLALVAEASQGHGEVTLNVERVGASLWGSGTGDRVHLRISAAGVHVWTSPWWVPIRAAA